MRSAAKQQRAQAGGGFIFWGGSFAWWQAEGGPFALRINRPAEFSDFFGQWGGWKDRGEVAGKCAADLRTLWHARAVLFDAELLREREERRKREYGNALVLRRQFEGSQKNDVMVARLATSVSKTLHAIT